MKTLIKALLVALIILLVRAALGLSSHSAATTPKVIGFREIVYGLLVVLLGHLAGLHLRVRVRPPDGPGGPRGHGPGPLGPHGPGEGPRAWAWGGGAGRSWSPCKRTVP